MLQRGEYASRPLALHQSFPITYRYRSHKKVADVKLSQLLHNHSRHLNISSVESTDGIIPFKFMSMIQSEYNKQSVQTCKKIFVFDNQTGSFSPNRNNFITTIKIIEMKRKSALVCTLELPCVHSISLWRSLENDDCLIAMRLFKSEQFTKIIIIFH